MVAMYVGLNKYADFSTSWEARIKEVEDCVAGSNRHLVEAAKWDSKLKGELVALQNSYDSRESVIWELEARIVEKDGALTRERA